MFLRGKLRSTVCLTWSRFHQLLALHRGLASPRALLTQANFLCKEGKFGPGYKLPYLTCWSYFFSFAYLKKNIQKFFWIFIFASWVCHCVASIWLHPSQLKVEFCCHLVVAWPLDPWSLRPGLHLSKNSAAVDGRYASYVAWVTPINFVTSILCAFCTAQCENIDCFIYRCPHWKDRGDLLSLKRLKVKDFDSFLWNNIIGILV